MFHCLQVIIIKSGMWKNIYKTRGVKKKNT